MSSLPPAVFRKLKWRVKRLSNLHTAGEEPDIFLFSTPRSGSTWLMEMLATQPGIKPISEPFWVPRFEGIAGPLPASWEFLLPHPQRESAIRAYLEALMANQLGIGSPAPWSRGHKWVSHRLVLKILRCKDLMNWCEETFGCRVIYLVRHPLAVSLSRRECPQLPHFLANEGYCRRFVGADLRDYASRILESGTDLEKKVVDWCLQNLPPLLYLDRRRWLCIHYEDLLVNPAAVVDRLASFLKLPDPARMHRQLRVPSRSTTGSDPDTRAHQARSGNRQSTSYLLDKWRVRVSDEEEKNAFAILARFAVDLYSAGESLPTRRLQGE
jgi:hypothetical protein